MDAADLARPIAWQQRLAGSPVAMRGTSMSRRSSGECDLTGITEVYRLRGTHGRIIAPPACQPGGKPPSATLLVVEGGGVVTGFRVTSA
jgi:hypothetical protein